LIKQFIRFVIVGGSGALLGFASMYLFTSILHIYYIIGYIVSFNLSLLSNYLWHTVWTFKVKSTAIKYGKYAIVSLLALGFTTLLMYLFTSVIGLWYMISLVIVTCCGLPLNYYLSKKFVWRAA
jgi:putative flippase GtrA